MTRRGTGELDETLAGITAAYIGGGVLAWLCGYGPLPLLVVTAVCMGLPTVFANLEETGSPLPLR